MDSINKGRPIVRKIDFQGLEISIETDKGQYRHWHDKESGEDGKTLMKYPYGYFCGMKEKGADGDQLDVFVGPNSDSDQVYVIHQMKRPDFDTFDEDKVMIGFESPKEAVAAYQEHFDNDKFLGSMDVLNIDDFKDKYVKKSFGQMPMQPGAMGAAMMKPPDDPDIPEAIPYMLGKIAKMGETDLMELSAKVWGPGYRYQNGMPEKIREELIGFLLDQKEMFDLVNKLYPIEQQNQMQQTQQPEQPQGSSASSQTSETGQTQESVQSKEENLSAGM